MNEEKYISIIKKNEEKEYDIIPASHSSNADKYGLGNKTKYGHCKIIDNFDADTYKEGECLSNNKGSELYKRIQVLTNAAPTTSGDIKGVIFSIPDNLECSQIIFLEFYIYDSEGLKILSKPESIIYNFANNAKIIGVVFSEEEIDTKNLYAIVYVDV